MTKNKRLFAAILCGCVVFAPLVNFTVRKIIQFTYRPYDNMVLLAQIER